MKIVKTVEAPEAEAEKPVLSMRPQAVAFRSLKFGYRLVMTDTMQTVLYVAFVMVVQMLVFQLRTQTEYYLDKSFNDMLIENPYDGLNKYPNIRRVQDIWVWGERVLWAGLFGDVSPTCAGSGIAGTFRSADMHAGPTNFNAVCNDDILPDGDGDHLTVGATAPTVDQLVARMNMLDWTDGIVITQNRAAKIAAADCTAPIIGASCIAGVSDSTYVEDLTTFGYNWSMPTAPLQLGFKAYTAVEMGSNPGGPTSCHPASYMDYPANAFATYILPFFSETLLPEERGAVSDVTDFRLTRVARGSSKTPNYFCVRLSWDGEHVHQLCDPNDPTTGRTTGVIRAAVVEFWGDMKRAHYIDASTRLVMITIPKVSNNAGVSAKVRIMLELTATGTVLPSFDSQTALIASGIADSVEILATLAFVLAIFFSMLEIFDILGLEDGVFELEDVLTYAKDMWNLMDWLCYILVFMTWKSAMVFVDAERNPVCSPICETLGHQDNYVSFDAARATKTYLSLCVCVQLLKIMKLAALHVPKMGLAPSVLKKALPDLVFFGFVFTISMMAFSSMFYIQLGAVMEGYSTNIGAFISLGRALFGDFNIDEIVDNSPNYMNTALYLIYLFVAVFILLSMFLAILGEAQANLRDDQRAATKEARRLGKEAEQDKEYGLITDIGSALVRGLKFVPVVNRQIEAKMLALEQAAANPTVEQATPVDRIEARQLEMGDNISELIEKLQQTHTMIQTLNARVDHLGLDSPSTPASQGQQQPPPAAAVPPAAEAAGGSAAAPTAASVDALCGKIERLEKLILSSQEAASKKRRQRPNMDGVGTAVKDGPPPRELRTAKTAAAGVGIIRQPSSVPPGSNGAISEAPLGSSSSAAAPASAPASIPPPPPPPAPPPTASILDA